MDKLIKKIKSIVPLKARVVLSYFRNINHNPYSLKALLNNDLNSSDFFVFDRDCSHIGFVAENIRAILLGKPIEVIHNFKFFSKDGDLINKQTYKSNDFFHKIIFDKINAKDKYISFIHYVESEHYLNEILKKKGVLKDLKISEQNRGYTTFYPSDLDSGVVVHGNFGGVSKNLEKMARQTILKHVYTPIYKFEEDLMYDLVFNNPTPKLIFIQIILNNSNQTSQLKIPSLGTQFFRISNYTGSISFVSRLPICRPLVFKNPTKSLSGNLDVFHS